MDRRAGRQVPANVFVGGGRLLGATNSIDMNYNDQFQFLFADTKTGSYFHIGAEASTWCIPRLRSRGECSTAARPRPGCSRGTTLLDLIDASRRSSQVVRWTSARRLLARVRATSATSRQICLTDGAAPPMARPRSAFSPGARRAARSSSRARPPTLDASCAARLPCPRATPNAVAERSPARLRSRPARARGPRRGLREGPVRGKARCT